MELHGMEETYSGDYLHYYRLSYENKNGNPKNYEIVSRNRLQSPEELGQKVSGVSMIVTSGERLLLLREFRMGINQYIYNLCAGMIEDGETMEQCIARELAEETGLRVRRIEKILPPSFAAVAISDVTTAFAFLEAEGELQPENLSENEEITPQLFTREELLPMLETEQFSSRAQLAAWYFCRK